MYAGVDIGGTKTLVAALNDEGVILERHKFPTPKDYHSFLEALQQTAAQLDHSDFKACGVAVPGKVDRLRGIGEYFGNLPWQHVPIQADTEKIFHCPVVIENDAKLGALSESMLLPKEEHVMYITISTGIGAGFAVNQQIAAELQDSEPGQMLLEYHGKRVPWEDFASGSAIVKRFGKKAKDITDEKSWRRIAHDLSLGFIELIAITQPDIILVGGSVGAYLDRFEAYLLEELKKYHNPLVPLPRIQRAARPDDAVIYGCYDLSKARYGTNN